MEERLRGEGRFEDADVLRGIRLCAIGARSAARHLYQDNMALRQLMARPDPLGEALNSGDGSYRP